MGCVERGRWTCPTCGRSFTGYGSEPDERAAVNVVRDRHARLHGALKVKPAQTRQRTKEQAT